MASQVENGKGNVIVLLAPKLYLSPPQVSILIGGNDLCSKSCVSTLQALGLSRRVKVEPRDFERNVRKSMYLP